MKGFVYLTVFLIILFLCGLWSPWLYINFDWETFIGLQKPDNIAGLEVYSLSGELEVYLRDDLVGKVTPESSPFIFDRVSPGLNLVRVRRVNPLSNFEYWQFSRVLDFQPAKSIVLSLNLGPTEESSEGQVISAVPKNNLSRPNRVTINANVEEYSVQVDAQANFTSDTTTFSTSFDVESQKRFRISKLGYEPIEFLLLPDLQEDRDRLKDFDLSVDVFLMRQIIDIINL